MTQRDTRDPFPPIPQALPLTVNPNEVDWSAHIQRRVTFTELVTALAGIVTRPDGLIRAAGGTALAPGLAVRDNAQGVFSIDADFLGLSNQGALRSAVTDAGLRGLEFHHAFGNTSTFTFTNTSYLDLDAVTGGSAGSAIAVTPPELNSMTDTYRALVLIAAQVSNPGGTTALSVRISGAGAVSSSDNWSAVSAATASQTVMRAHVFEGLDATDSAQSFELQARVTAGTGSMNRTFLGVIPLLEYA